VVAALLGAGIVLGSRVPYAVEGSPDALVRLSWRAVGERVEECRTPTEAELAALPPHMRRREICEGRILPFRLSVAIDGEPRFGGEIHASGAREDRPTYILEEFRVAPGEHRVAVRFEVVRRGPPVRAPLLFEETVTLASRSVLLVTEDEAGERLTSFGPERRPKP
jgi:hypothetical protein